MKTSQTATKVILLAAFFIAVNTISEAASFRCGNRVISDGDRKYDVIMKCQRPLFSDYIEKEVIRRVSENEWRKFSVQQELWLYNYGPASLMRLMVFENEKLMEIRTLGYGYPDGETGRYTGDISKISRGMTSVEVAVHWGRPTYKSERVEERIIRTHENSYVKSYVTISEWIYNLGPSRLTKILSFENGELTDISDGEYGM